MTHGIDAAMQRMQTPALQPMADGATTEPQSGKLRAGDHPMLAHRERRDPPIDARPPQFGPYDGLKCTFASHPADLGRQTAPGKDRIATTLSQKRDRSRFLDAPFVN